MAKVYGIDLGTTYSVIATLTEDGLPEVIENYDDSVPVLASAVYFPEGSEPVVGKEAKNQAEFYPERVVQFIKRKIGKPNAGTFNFDGVDYDPITISALILKRMAEYAAEQGHDVKDVVITCPAYFGTEERIATKQAGIVAGLNVLDIVNEPTAAALNYCCKEFCENRKIMVYDLGGGTFDITLFDFSVNQNNESTIDVIRTDGNDLLGGADWDKCLYELICEKYEAEEGIGEDSMDVELRAKLHAVVEETKKSLSKLPQKSFTINYGASTRLDVSREEFESATTHLVQQTISLVDKVLQDSGLTADDVDTVLLVGGSTRMPMIQNAVKEKFGAEKVRMEDPDLAVAKGAALAAALHWNETHGVAEEPDAPAPTVGGAEAPDAPAPEAGKAEERIKVGGGKIDLGGFQDKLPRSFGPAIITPNNQYMIDNLLYLGDPAPAVFTKEYGTSVANQRSVKLAIFENVSTVREAGMSYVTPCLDENDNEQYTDPLLKVKYLGVLTMDLPDGLPEGSPIEVTFDFSTAGLYVTARNPLTGQEIKAQIVSPNTKTEEEVRRDSERLAAITTTGQA